jgi:hypothetical protein
LFDTALNFLGCSKENNKENIGEQVSTQQNPDEGKGKPYKTTFRRFENQRHKITERRLYRNYVPHNNTSAPMEANATVKTTNINRPNGNNQEGANEIVKNGDIGSDGEFQTVAPKSARRKEKLKEQREYVEPQTYRSKDKPRLHGRNGESNERLHKEREYLFNAKDGSKDKEKEKDKDTEVYIEESEQQPIKYIEAPLPIVNPWTKSKVNTTQPAAPAPATIPVHPVTAPVPVSMDKLIEKVKRVFLPQQEKTKTGKFLVTYKVKMRFKLCFSFKITNYKKEVYLN